MVHHRHLVWVVLALTLAGCLDSNDARDDSTITDGASAFGRGIPYDYTENVRDSFRSTFGGIGNDTYRLLLVENWVVCVPDGVVDRDGEGPLQCRKRATADPTVPVVDPRCAFDSQYGLFNLSAGALRTSAPEFQSRRSDVVFVVGGCDGFLQFFHREQFGPFVWNLQGTGLMLHYEPEGTFRIGGDMLLRPGSALEIRYRLQAGDERDQQRDPTIVGSITYPGEWLRDRIEPFRG